MNGTFQELSDNFLRSYFSCHPTYASQLGWPGYDDVMPDYSDERINSYLQEWRSLLKQVESVSAPDIETRIDADLLARIIRRTLFSYEVERHHVINPASTIGTVADSLWELMMGQHRTDEAKCDALMARLKLIPTFLKNMAERHEKPVTLWTHIAVEEAPGLVSYLTETVLPFLESKQTAGDSTLIELACHAVDEFIIEIKQRSTQDNFAIGTEHFESLLQQFHRIDKSSNEILEIGLHQTKIISKQLEEHAAKMDAGKSWTDLIQSLKTDHPSEEELLSAYREKVAEIKEFLKEHEIVSLPDDESLQIIETPSFLQDSIPYAAYSEPTMFASDGRGTFFVSPARGNQEVLMEHCRAAFPLTALHEAYPGHHLQFATQRQLKSPVRKIYNVASYYEGWTLYCEEMMYREGFYDEAMRLYQLKDRLWRAARIVVDVSMHCLGMGDQEAADYLVEHAKLSPQGARVDVNWYTQSPTVPMSYLVGMLEVDQLREDYQATGKNLREFHDAFLSCGAIPLASVRELLFSREAA